MFTEKKNNGLWRYVIPALLLLAAERIEGDPVDGTDLTTETLAI